MSELIGRTLGPYQIVELVGQGGMASVYKAYQATVDRYVALKILPEALKHDPTFAQRFEQEARLIARLEHPHILPIYDFGVSEGYTYLAMRFITSGTLKELIAVRGALPLAQVARLMMQVGDALDCAHGQGVVHRDIKPSNVLLDARGDTFLADFGIAKMIAGSAQITGTAIIGTPAYMAPEQALGERLSARTDVYALGVMLYEMVTGRVPFDADTPMAVIVKHINEPLPPPRTRKPDLPAAVEALIIKALEKRPDDRFASAGELAHALAEAVGTQTFARGPLVGGTPQPVDMEHATGAPEASDGATITAPPLSPPNAPGKVTLEAGGDAADTGAPVATGVVARVVDSVGAGSAGAVPDTAGDAMTPAPVPLWSPKGWPRWWPVVAVVVVLVLLTLSEVVSLVGGPGAATPTVVVTPDAAATAAATHWGGQTEFYTDYAHIHALVAGPGGVWTGGPGGLVQWDVARGPVAIFTTENGLSDNVVNDVLRAPDGTLWVATAQGGVLHQDAESPGGWQRYDLTSVLGTPDVSQIYAEADPRYSGGGSGTLLAFGVNTRVVARFANGSWGPLTMPEITFDIPAVQDVYRAPDGGLWLATNGAGLLRVRSGQLRRFTRADGLPSDDVRALAPLELEADALWVGTAGGLVRISGDTPTVVSAGGREAAINGIAKGADGLWWFASSAGVEQFNTEFTAWTHYDLPDGMAASTIVVDTLGPMWAGTARGLATFADNAWTLVPGSARVALGGGYQFVEWDGALAVLRAVGEHGGARVVQIAPSGVAFTAVQALNDYPIVALAGGPAEHTLYLATKQGVYALAAGATEPTRLSGGDEPVDVQALAVATDGSVWATSPLGVHSYTQGRWVTYSGGSAPTQETLLALVAGPENQIWVVWGTGIARVRLGGEMRWTSWARGRDWPADVGALTTLTVGADRRVWVGTESGAVLQFVNGVWQVVLGPAPSGIRALGALAGGHVLAAVAAGGVYQWDGTSWRLGVDGLNLQSVSAIYIDERDWGWLATESGLARWQP